MNVRVVQKVLKVNDEIAMGIRQRLQESSTVAINIISAPGSGKTTLIERTIEALRDRLRIAVIEGDPETTRDAERIAALNVPVIQINTAGGCHLEANLVARAIDDLRPESFDLIMIENVGNLVCPVDFDLGETRRAVIASVTEGHDKAAKYSKAFRRADMVVLNKIDMLPMTDFRPEIFWRDVKSCNPRVTACELSCSTREGLTAWLDFVMATAAPVINPGPSEAVGAAYDYHEPYLA